LKIKEKKQRQINHCCSICGKKLKKFKRRRTSKNPLSCWWCMILNNADSGIVHLGSPILDQAGKKGKRSVVVE
jgi:hypothetical protein